MKTKRYYVVLMALLGIICPSVLGGVDLPQTDDDMVLVKVNPTLAGVKGVRVSVVISESGIDTEKLSDRQKFELCINKLRLEKKVSDKLNKAGIKALPQSMSGSIGLGTHLSIRLNTLKLDDFGLYVFHIQTSLWSGYYSTNRSNRVEVNVWESAPVMKAVPQEDKQDTITKMVMEQIETFINAYLAAKPPDKHALDMERSDIASAKAKKKKREHTEFVAECLRDFESIKLGMSRAEIEQRFPMDGGMQGVSPVRFIHSRCNYFKVDIEFEFKRDPDDQGRAIRGKGDRVTKVSKPYIERQYID